MSNRFLVLKTERTLLPALLNGNADLNIDLRNSNHFGNQNDVEKKGFVFFLLNMENKIVIIQPKSVKLALVILAKGRIQWEALNMG